MSNERKSNKPSSTDGMDAYLAWRKKSSFDAKVSVTPSLVQESLLKDKNCWAIIKDMVKNNKSVDLEESLSLSLEDKNTRSILEKMLNEFKVSIVNGEINGTTTILGVAICYGAKEVRDFLLREFPGIKNAGVLVDYTPLHMAASINDLDTVEELYEAGADLHAHNSRKQSAFELFEEHIVSSDILPTPTMYQIADLLQPKQKENSGGLSREESGKSVDLGLSYDDVFEKLESQASGLHIETTEV